MSEVGAPHSLTVLGEIASGGMGSVELARLAEADGHRLVAVKRMHPEYAKDQEFVRMFRDEIWLTGSLNHENVVGLVGWGEDDAGPYLVMEYVDGIALARIALNGRRAGEPMPSELVAYVLARAADGLHAAHQLKDADGRPLDIVHRDVTPSNILVGYDGSVRLTDFGIAKASGKSSHTRTGTIKGKIVYMSPEYAQRRAVDSRADLYSLGVCAFELCSGKLPFEARGDLELLKLVAYSAAPKLASVVSHVDRDLAAIVDRLLSKEADSRYASGAELARALDTWLLARGRLREELEEELAAFAARHAGTTRAKLAMLLEEDTSAEPAGDDTGKRPRLETRTFTLFRPLAHPEKEPVDARPATRRVAVSGYPPAPVVGSNEVDPSTTVMPPLERSATAFEAPEPRVASSPRAAEVPLLAKRPRQSSAVVTGVIVGSVAALLLVLVSVLASSRRAPATTVPSSKAPPLTSLSPIAEPPTAITTEVPAVTPSDLPPAVESAAPVASERPRPTNPIRPRGTGGKSAGSTKPRKPCTPDSFDYPSCLKR